MDNEGWEVDELASEAGLSALQLRKWVSSESDISLGDLRKMSDKFRRPMSVLFMAEAPDTVIPPRYRRRCGGGQAKPRMSRDMLDVIREARFVQDNAAELLHEAGRSACPDVCTATLEQSPETEAARNAEILTIGPLREAGDGEEARYRGIRERIEARNIFVLQDAIPASDEASGLALANPRPAVVLVNSRDPARRRIFALLHEYAHILLGSDGVCSAGTEPGGGIGRLPRVELWCDRFAGAALVPGDKSCAALDGEHGAAGDGDPHRAAPSPPGRFSVGGGAALARAVEVPDGGEPGLRYVPYHGRLNRGAAAPDAGGGGRRNAAGGPSPAALCMARRGRRYARLVSDAEESGIITTSTALEYLGIKLDHLYELEILCGAGWEAAGCAAGAGSPADHALRCREAAGSTCMP